MDVSAAQPVDGADDRDRDRPSKSGTLAHFATIAASDWKQWLTTSDAGTSGGGGGDPRKDTVVAKTGNADK